jgi:hypothetical protein
MAPTQQSARQTTCACSSEWHGAGSALCSAALSSKSATLHCTAPHCAVPPSAATARLCSALCNNGCHTLQQQQDKAQPASATCHHQLAATCHLSQLIGPAALDSSVQNMC